MSDIETCTISCEPWCRGCDEHLLSQVCRAAEYMCADPDPEGAALLEGRVIFCYDHDYDARWAYTWMIR